MIHVGAATRTVTPDLGSYIQAAGHQNRATSIRDDLEANALYLANGDTAVLLVSCDLVALEPDFVAAARTAMAGRAGLHPRDIILACTHTHSGPSLIPTNYLMPLDTAYMDRLQAWLVELAAEAVTAARPARLAWGRGSVQIGYNRRCCWADGSHSLGGDATRADFTGMEGPDDPAHLALFAEDADGRLIALLHSNTSHPTTFYGGTVYSSDYPGVARKSLRESLGTVPVLYFNGCIGDMGPENKRAPRPRGESNEQKIARAGHLLAGETLRLLYETSFHDDAVLAHAYEDLPLSVRQPEPALVAWAKDVLARVDAGEEVNTMDRLRAHGFSSLVRRFGERPIDTVPIHAVRIGEAALVTQPCELYCQFGLDIKRRSPAALTAVCGPADGYNGYCPTIPAILGGGYSGEPYYWCRLADDAGYRIVETAAKLVNGMW